MTINAAARIKSSADSFRTTILNACKAEKGEIPYEVSRALDRIDEARMWALDYINQEAQPAKAEAA